MNKRKKIGFSVLFASATAITAFNLSNSRTSTTDSNDLAFFIQTANASSERGCISRTKNNGDCTSDGTMYFCENSVWFHDCVRGVYP